MHSIRTTFFVHRRAGDTPDTERPISCEIQYTVNQKRQRLQFSTGQTCKLRHFKDGRVWHSVSFAVQINDRLHEIRDGAERIYRKAIERGEMPTPARFKEMILVGTYEVDQERDLLTDLEAFAGYHRNKGTHRGSLCHVVKLQEHLRAFSRAESFTLAYGNINLDFYARFVKYLRGRDNGRGTGARYNDNTVGNYIKKLKMFLNWSHANGWNKFQAYKHRDFRIPEKRVENVYLDQPELDTLLFLDLRKRPGLAATRDWFLLATQIGMRFGDYGQIRQPEAIKEVKKDGQTVGYDFHYYPTKTSKSSGVKCVVPLSQIAIQILQRHAFNMPAMVTEAAFNRNLKDLARLAGIVKNITSHDARRTFATLEYLAGTPTQFIMQITGHRTEKEFRKYLCLAGEENADMVRQMHPGRFEVKTPGLKEGKLRIA